MTRYLKSLIHIGYRGTESLWIVGFLSDQSGLSALRSRDTWPDTWACKAVRCWGFECWPSHALYSICFWLNVCAIRCYCHLARPCVVFHRWVINIVAKVEANITKTLFHYRKQYEYIIQPPGWWIEHMCQCSRQRIKMYTKLPTYKTIITDQCSRNLELLSHCHTQF
jgi:hypothetical protein